MRAYIELDDNWVMDKIGKSADKYIEKEAERIIHQRTIGFLEKEGLLRFLRDLVDARIKEKIKRSEK